MSMITTRRRALLASAGFLGLAAVAGRAQSADEAPEEFPKQDYGSVRAVVGAAHFDYDRVKELVSVRPALAKASWDWGFGDWETPLGSASHMGRPDIAELLMEYGARPNLFTHAMLGHVEVVQAAVETTPGVQRTGGPHGIPLRQHALNTTRRDNVDAAIKAGAQQVADYLEEVGGADAREPSQQLSEADKQVYFGSYRYGEEENQLLQVEPNDFTAMSLKREGQDARPLHYVGDHVFAPSGAPEVQIRFVIENERAVRLTVHDPMPLVTAQRVDGD